jgi:putative DNA primase/helicase
VNLLPGIDIRADGGFVVAPPSRHKSGRIYAWEISCHPDETQLAELPEWFLTLASKGKEKVVREASNGDLWNEGNRNDSLFRFAAKLNSQGMTIDEIETIILIENTKRCRPPLSPDEVKKIAQSAGKYKTPITVLEWTNLKELPPLA